MSRSRLPWISMMPTASRPISKKNSSATRSWLLRHCSEALCSHGCKHDSRSRQTGAEPNSIRELKEAEAGEHRLPRLTGGTTRTYVSRKQATSRYSDWRAALHDRGAQIGCVRTRLRMRHRHRASCWSELVEYFLDAVFFCNHLEDYSQWDRWRLLLKCTQVDLISSPEFIENKPALVTIRTHCANSHFSQ